MDGSVIALSLGSALSAAVSTTLKKAAAGRAARRSAESSAPARHLAGLGRPLWLAGLAADVLAIALQVVALHYGTLALVQPLLITGLLFALLLRHIGVGRISAHELMWVLVLIACLVGFLTFSGAMSASQPPGLADRAPAIVVAVATVATIAICLVLAHRSVPPSGRAALLGAATGGVYAVTAALIKSSTEVLAAHGLVALLASWQLYATLTVAGAGQLLAQHTFQAGPITSSLPATSTIDPLLSVLIGVTIYDEQLHRGPAGGAVLLVLLLLLVASVVQLGRVETAETETDPAAKEPAAT